MRSRANDPVVLARMLLHGGPCHRFRSQAVPFDLDDVLVRLVVERETRIMIGERSYVIDADRSVRAVLATQPRAIWIARFRADDREGDLIAFAPPRVADLAGPVPLRVPERLASVLADQLDLRAGDDALKVLSTRVGGRDLCITGQRSIAALSDEDARNVTWWLANGYVLETRLVTSERGAWLEAIDVVSPRRIDDAACGPNTIIELAGGARLTVTGEHDDRVADAAPAAFVPPRSPLFEVWARYAVLRRAQRKEQLDRRAAAPLRFTEARQHDKGWTARAPLDDAALLAWLGPSRQEGHDVKLGQVMRLVDDDSPVGWVTLDKMRLVSTGLVELRLRTGGELRRLPEHGELRVTDDRGEETKANRERDALDALRAGRAACPALLDILHAPSAVQPPRTVELARPAREALDHDQAHALRLILGCQDVVAIQGPPGTGKTRVIVEALRQLAAHGVRKGRRVRVLVSSVQNEAIRNVVERLGQTDGVLVNMVMRAARDEDESFQVAESRNTAREQVLERLAARLRASNIAQRTAHLRDLQAEIDRVRTLASAAPGRRLVDELRRWGPASDIPLPALLREEAGLLADALERQLATEPAAEVSTGVAAMPASPADAAPWWSLAGPGWPVERRALVGAAVAAVAGAVEGARTNPVRFGRRIEPAWQALLAAIGQAPATVASSRTDATTSGATLQTTVDRDATARLDAWIQQIGRELQALSAGLESSPDAIAARFHAALRADHLGWQSILDRHGNATAATCSMSATTRTTDAEPYDWVIIDEAGRASPFELLVPMTQGRRIVLIGDHRQLPPTVEDEVADAIDRERTALVDLRTETLFGTLYRTLPAPCRAALTMQYRMHAEMGRVVDELFYSPHAGERLDSYFVGDRERERRPAWGVLDDRPLAWLDVPRGARDIYSSQEECDAVVELLERYPAPADQAPFIGVICSYSAQRDLIQRALDRRSDLAQRATVHTIDAVQGREYPVVIFCLVRNDGKPGFLAAPNRVNVAISRAQRQLVIVGSVEAFGGRRVRDSARHLALLVDHCRRRNNVVRRERRS